MELKQNQTQLLNHLQLQSIALLQMSAQELEVYLRELSLENPVVEPEECSPASEDPRDEDLLHRLQWLEDNDRQNLFYQHADEDELDPLTRVGTEGGLEETLFRFLSRQLDCLKLPFALDRAARFLAACLDDSGYLRLSPEALAGQSEFTADQLKQALALLQSLEPAGVGAVSLSQCLELQLLRLGETGAALSIVRNHLEALARRRYHAIAAALHISPQEVSRAAQLIQGLEPRPGAAFEKPEQVFYVQPDIFVQEEHGRFTVHPREKDGPPFRISRYYRDLLAHAGDPAVQDYLVQKIRQAEDILRALDQRESTLLRCAQVIVQHQQVFFRLGPGALNPLRMADIARELGLHESTVSRAVREKYLQCSLGIYPLSYFFMRNASADLSGAMGSTAARSLLKQLLDNEDKSCPLSDQRLCEEMAARGCPISRRTVAKYRDEMNIPGVFGRKR